MPVIPSFRMGSAPARLEHAIDVGSFNSRSRMGSAPARLEHAIDVGSFNSRSRMGSEYHSVTSIALYRFRLLHQKINEAADFRAEVTAVGVGGVQGDAA